MNAVIRWIATVPLVAPAVAVAFAAAAPVLPAVLEEPAGQDIPLSLVEAGMASHYIRVTVSGCVS
jgi:hypothetical protein